MDDGEDLRMWSGRGTIPLSLPMAPVEPNEASRVTLEAWLATDVGVVRPHNEDTAHVDGNGSFFIVADGMGGHAAGEVASAMAVDTVRAKLESARHQVAEFAKAPTDVGRRSLVQLLQDAVLSAHQAVFQRGSTEEDKYGMGTTLDVLLISGVEAFVAHVGDSRTYLIRDGRASQLTTDHTYAEVMVIEGKLTIEEAQVSQLRNVLVNAIGVSTEVGVEMAHLELRRDDRLLMCSDGLHDYFPGESEIAERLTQGDTGLGLTTLVDLAKTRGGHDNITGIAIHVVELFASPQSLTQDETQPVLTVAPASAAEESTETTALPDLDVDGDDSGSERVDNPDKKARSKRVSGRGDSKASGRPQRKSKPTRDKLSTVNSSDDSALADTLPPTLLTSAVAPKAGASPKEPAPETAGQSEHARDSKPRH
jgi:serine/threonine protein phosphatase PrpC